MDPSSSSLRDPNFLGGLGLDEPKLERVRSWILFNNNQGFGARLWKWLAELEVASEKYEDLIEQRLCTFKLAKKSVVFGPKENSAIETEEEEMFV